jgi:uncharacterized protein (TIGR02996 family)
MTERDALIAAIISHPDEDTPRLMFADWLDEHGDSPRAEFIRIQVELARMRAAEADLPESFGTGNSGGAGPWYVCWRPHYTEERIALLKREAELLNAHSEEWRKGLPKYADNAHTRRAVQFRRGFVGHVVTALGTLMTAPAALWKHHAVESLFLMNLAGSNRRKIPACKHLAAVRELHFVEGEYDGEMFAPFADCPYLSELRTLNLSAGGLPTTTAKVLAQSPHLRPVALKFTCHELGEEGFVALVNGPFASRLRRFEPYRTGPWGAEIIASAPLSELRLLELRSGSFGDSGVATLTQSKHLTQLVTLDIGFNRLTDAALETLAAWPGLASVRALNVGDNDLITDRGIAALLKSPYLKPIHLGLRRSWAGDAGAKELAAWPGLAGIVDLDLSYAKVRDAGLAALADSPHWRDLRYLKLTGNGQFERETVRRLRERIGGHRTDIWGW